MKTNQIEKMIGRKFDSRQSLKGQTTELEYAQISWETCIETAIEVEKGRPNNTTRSIKDIEKEVRTKFKAILDEYEGDYLQALSAIP